MGVLYMQPEDLWIHAAPPALLFGSADQGDQGIDQGSITAPVRTLGTGSGKVAAGGIPRGAWAVLIRCSTGGEVNDPNTLNLSANLPAFELSRDGGATYSAPITVSQTRDKAEIAWAKFGMRFFFENGGAPPSFVAGDVWSCQTQPSADIIAGIPVVCAMMDKYLSGSFDLPLTSFPADFAAIAADLLRWRLLRKIGIAEKEDIAAYKPVESWEWLRAAQKGEFVKPQTSLGIAEQPPGTSFPLLVPPLPDPLWPPI